MSAKKISPSPSHASNEADAALIASAPELLSTLIEMKELFSHTWTCVLDMPVKRDLAGPFQMAPQACLRCRIEAAILKATGGAE